MATINSINTNTGASGTILQGAGVGSTPVFSTATYPATAGTSGKVLASNGTNIVASTPTFPVSASATTRKIIVSDGTNWVASTETYAVPGTSGNLLTSNGTNWLSSTPVNNLVTLTGTLTNAQIKALHATPVQVLAAPGAGKWYRIVQFTGKMIYGGTNVFTAAAAQTINFYYSTTVDTGMTVISNAVLVGSATTYLTGNSQSATFTTSVENLALNLYNPIATEITGNAANNNTASYSLVYQIMSI